MIYQLLRGVDYCHSKRVIHRDLKPQNLLVNNKGNIKICDFGLARAFTIPIKTLTHEVETLWYRAPEILLGKREYSLGVDMWAIGCIFTELIQKRPLFMGDSEIDQIFKIFQFHGTPTEKTWPGISKLPNFKTTFPKFRMKDAKEVFSGFTKNELDLAMSMIALDPCKRITARQALKHPYFDDLIRWSGPTGMLKALINVLTWI